MNDQMKNIGEQLIQQTKDSQKRDETAGLMHQLVRDGQIFEARVRKMAIISWSVVLTSLVLGGTALLVIQMGTDPWLDPARAVLIVLFVVLGISLLMALLSTISWLFRSRAPSLAVIEHRLATLEQLILNQANVGAK